MENNAMFYAGAVWCFIMILIFSGIGWMAAFIMRPKRPPPNMTNIPPPPAVKDRAQRPLPPNWPKGLPRLEDMPDDPAEQAKILDKLREDYLIENCPGYLESKARLEEARKKLDNIVELDDIRHHLWSNIGKHNVDFFCEVCANIGDPAPCTRGRLIWRGEDEYAVYPSNQKTSDDVPLVQFSAGNVAKIGYRLEDDKFDTIHIEIYMKQ